METLLRNAQPPPIRGATTTHIAGSFRKDSWQGQAPRRPIRCGVQIAGDGGEQVGAARVLVCTFTMELETFDFLVTDRECVDRGKRRIRRSTGRAESTGQEILQVPEGSL